MTVCRVNQTITLQAFDEAGRSSYSDFLERHYIRLAFSDGGNLLVEAPGPASDVPGG
jgi:hypothetical protein